MKNSEIVKNFSLRNNIPQSLAHKYLDDFLFLIKESLIKDKAINFKNFGSFRVVERKHKTFLNPKTRTITKISPNKLSFKASNNFKKHFN